MERSMRTADTTIEAFANTGPSSADALRDYAPMPRPALGPALTKQGYYAGQVERHLYRVRDGSFQPAFLTTSDGDARDGHTQRRQR
jgi:hypothetical protein